MIFEKPEIQDDRYTGYAVFYCRNNPIGVVSAKGARNASLKLEKVPVNFIRYLVAIEDKRFYEHGAIDIKGICRAIFKNIQSLKIVQGGSTLTQQLARNLLHDNKKSIYRKLKEIFLAIRLENKYSKKEILELYFNNVFWGKNIYGLRAASLAYFSSEPNRLSISQQISLLTFLRGPNYYLRNSLIFLKRHEMLRRKLYDEHILSGRNISKMKKQGIEIGNNKLEIFNKKSIPFIAHSINVNDRSVITSLNKDLQARTLNFLNNCKYPTSVLCLSDGKIISVASSKGSEYPFYFRSNVGSTLKPFIYTFLRQNGVSATDKFATNNIHKLKWDINEVIDPGRKFITLREALLLSNNNTFVNASYEFGIEKILSYLAKLLNKPTSNFVSSSILGATNEGVTLYELAKTYYSFFIGQNEDPFANECNSILQENAQHKFMGELNNSFLKTGTTNFNQERFAIVGYGKSLFAFLRQENESNDYSKEGNFLFNILDFLKGISKTQYRW